MSVWLLFIILHAAAALISFAAGLAVIKPEHAKRRPYLLTVYLISLGLMLVAMVAATISHWNEIDTVSRIVFAGLPILGAYMLYRALHARTLIQSKLVNKEAYIQDIGFTLISYFNGFVIVAAIDLGAPAWSVATIAIIATLIGNQLLNKAKRNWVQ